MDVLKKKLKGATLIESVIAMVIIVLSLGIITLVFGNVMENDSSKEKLDAALVLNDISIEERRQAFFLDGQEDKEELSIKKTFEKYQDLEDIVVMKLQAFKKDKLILERKELIYLK